MSLSGNLEEFLCSEINTCTYTEFKKMYFYVKFAVRPLSREITMSQAYQNMCAGMYKVTHLCSVCFRLFVIRICIHCMSSFFSGN